MALPGPPDPKPAKSCTLPSVIQDQQILGLTIPGKCKRKKKDEGGG